MRSSLNAAEAAELEHVDSLADRLLKHLTERAADLQRIHVYNAPSKAIQNLVAETLIDALDFKTEVVLTPQDGLVTRSRPDFVYNLAPGRGILAEVERGGTVNNNHDLKDLWKTHVAADAQHLFLVVPESNWRADGTAREKPFPRVDARMGAFFGDPRREIDVVSVHVFGY